tara:strand:+ start:959 stop:1408 length:450 start_codon:yes stop_codon:yes gene_type:complete
LSQTVEWKSSKSYLVPSIPDTNTLFFNDSLIWYCRYEGENSNRQISNASFDKVDTCSCFYWLYAQKRSKGHIYSRTYPIIVKKELRATLSKIDTNTFIYNENPQFKSNPKTYTYIFKTDSILSTDTSFIENEFGDLKMEAYDYFWVEKK